jgi:CBS domain-containing protein
MFAGASRAYLTSIVFALEATMQSHALLPLLGACTGAYIVSFFLMENTIMTEKIVRRGLLVPDSFSPDLLQKITVAQVVKGSESLIKANTSIHDVKAWVSANLPDESHFVVVNEQGEYAGTIRLSEIFDSKAKDDQPIKTILKTKVKATVNGEDALRRAIERMSKNDVEVLPVVTHVNPKVVIGVLTYKDIIDAYSENIEKDEFAHVKISLRRRGMKMMVKGRQGN